jgi:hypothetical protein
VAQFCSAGVSRDQEKSAWRRHYLFLPVFGAVGGSNHASQREAKNQVFQESKGGQRMASGAA